MIIDSRYEVLEELGSGLWATVYKVKDIRTEAIYALKLFQKIDTLELYDKFSAENMHHITKITHPNLIHVSNFGNYNGHIYYISEYLNGQSLQTFRFRKVNIEFLYDIIVQICYALDALHSQDIIHKDLKPGNVIFRIIDDKPDVKVMDYGFTKIDVDNNQQMISHSLPFIAPEIYMNKGATFQSDFYSLGVILYKLTTGALPYTAEQIMGFIAGDSQNLFPKFPRELNSEIPAELEKLITKLLERNPEDRFSDAGSIIAYINTIQLNQYQYSRSWSVVHNIQFSDYIAREDYAHQILDYLPIIKNRNGKLIVMNGGRGLGKDNILSLFKYHILNDEYFIFDYACSAKNKDPFFALIKEFYFANKNNKDLSSDLDQISEKMATYLYKSEEEATTRVQDKTDLFTDFQTVSRFIFHLSEIKPLIFIIRAGQFLEPEVIDFVNFISNEITHRPIMILLSVNDPRKIEGLIHTVRIKIEPLNLKQTKEYVTKLLMENPPDSFTKKLWGRSFGNPLFIEQILIDLTQKQKIWDSNKFTFNYDLDNYALPETVVHSIYDRMSHLMENSYRNLQKLSVIYTPMSKELIRYILEIPEKEIFFLINDGLNNEIISRNGEYYEFTFAEAVTRFREELTSDEVHSITKKVLEYFETQQFSMIPVLIGIIKHARELDDYVAVRKFSLKLVDLYIENDQHNTAFEKMCYIMEINFSGNILLSQKDLRTDLQKLLTLSEWSTAREVPENLKKSILLMPDITEKYLLIGAFFFVLEKYKLAAKNLERASALAITGHQRILASLYLGEIYSNQSDWEKLGKIIIELDSLPLSSELMITYIGLKGIYLGSTGNIDGGIMLIEDYLLQIRTENDDSYFIKLGNLYNTLAFLYHLKKQHDDAEKNFHAARKIWERINYMRKLGVVYNNIGDVALIKGDTKTALEYFQKALEICSIIDCRKTKILSLLNHAETYIKLGKFDYAEKYLNQSMQKTKQQENKPFMSSIINNMAIAKSKTYNLGYYYQFIKKYVPILTKGKVDKITPLTKTYFYFLYNIGDYHKIEKFLSKNTQLFIDSKQQEFYYQMLGALKLNNKEYDKALEYLEMAFSYSRQNKSVYAQAINYIRLAELYIAMKEMDKAENLLDQAEQICDRYNFAYWKLYLSLKRVYLDLMNPKLSLRVVIRNLYAVLEPAKELKLYMLELEIYSLLTQIYSNINIKKLSNLFWGNYKNCIETISTGLKPSDKEIFYQKSNYYLHSYSNLKTVDIVQRYVISGEKWQDELYDILKLKEIKRMKFFIKRTINNVLSPNLQAIVLSEALRSSKENNKDLFLKDNISADEIYSDKYLPFIIESLNDNEIISKKIDGCNTLFVPLRIKTAKVGCLILADKGELKFLKSELSIIKFLRLHLTSILMRIKEYVDLNNEMELMTKLAEISQKFFSILEIEKLEQEVVSFAMDFTGATRGFMITKDSFQNYVYRVALDDSRHMLKKYSFVSKAILSEVQKLKEPVYIQNAKESKVFDSYLDFNEEHHKIYCAPIMIDSDIHGFIYMDNFGHDEVDMLINQEYMRLLLLQISVAFKNADQYERLRQKNREIKLLDGMKKDFISITSHELKTPLVAIQGYVRRLTKANVSEGDKTIISKLDLSVGKLLHITNDILEYNRFQLANKLDMGMVEISSLLAQIIDDLSSKAAKRNMMFKLEIEDDIPEVMINWESFEVMMRNLVLNSIRFTKDFGTIVIGARRSAFLQEEVKGKESIVIYVKDNGIGIPEHELKNIFHEFYEVNDIFSHSSGIVEYKSSGLGLGLSTAKIVADKHNGKIWLNSKENEGTTVFVAIPLSDKS